MRAWGTIKEAVKVVAAILLSTMGFAVAIVLSLYAFRLWQWLETFLP